MRNDLASFRVLCSCLDCSHQMPSWSHPSSWSTSILPNHTLSGALVALTGYVLLFCTALLIGTSLLCNLLHPIRADALLPKVGYSELQHSGLSFTHSLAACQVLFLSSTYSGLCITFSCASAADYLPGVSRRTRLTGLEIGPALNGRACSPRRVITTI